MSTTQKVGDDEARRKVWENYSPVPLGSHAGTEKDPAMKLVFQLRRQKEREAKRLEREEKLREARAVRKSRRKGKGRASAKRTKSTSGGVSITLHWGMSPEIDEYVMKPLEAAIQAAYVSDGGVTEVTKRSEFDTKNVDIKQKGEKYFFPLFQRAGFDLISFVQNNPDISKMIVSELSPSNRGQIAHPNSVKILGAGDAKAHYKVHPDFPECVGASAAWNYTAVDLTGEGRINKEKGWGRDAVLRRKDGSSEPILKICRCTSDGATVVPSVTKEGEKLPTREGDIWRLREIIVLAE
jgi:hypothetical protein